MEPRLEAEGVVATTKRLIEDSKALIEETRLLIEQTKTRAELRAMDGLETHQRSKRAGRGPARSVYVARGEPITAFHYPGRLPRIVCRILRLGS